MSRESQSRIAVRIAILKPKKKIAPCVLFLKGARKLRSSIWGYFFRFSIAFSIAILSISTITLFLTYICSIFSLTSWGGGYFFFQKITLLQIDIVFSSGWWSLVLRLMSAITLLEIVSCSFYGSAVRCEWSYWKPVGEIPVLQLSGASRAPIWEVVLPAFSWHVCRFPKALFYFVV